MSIARFVSFKSAVVVAVGLLLTSPPIRAGDVPLPATLDQLLPSGNYTTVGDKTFTFLSFDSTSIGSTPVPASAIGVTAMSGSSANPVSPFGFQLSGPITAPPQTSTDLVLNFTVASSGAPITAVNLFSNGSATGNGNANVSESVFTLAPNGAEGTFLGQLTVVGAGTASLNLGAGYSALYIAKNIVVSNGASGTGIISIIDQTFTQATVPEPGSMALLGLGAGLVGTYGIARARRKSSTL